MVYTLTCTVEAFCTFLARNKYNCQAVCRTAAAVWVQTGDTQLYVHLTECKHRHYYASPVRTESAFVFAVLVLPFSSSFLCDEYPTAGEEPEL